MASLLAASLGLLPSKNYNKQLKDSFRGLVIKEQETEGVYHASTGQQRELVLAIEVASK